MTAVSSPWKLPLTLWYSHGLISATTSIREGLCTPPKSHILGSFALSQQSPWFPCFMPSAQFQMLPCLAPRWCCISPWCSYKPSLAFLFFSALCVCFNTGWSGFLSIEHENLSKLSFEQAHISQSYINSQRNQPNNSSNNHTLQSQFLIYFFHFWIISPHFVFNWASTHILNLSNNINPLFFSF